MNCTNCGSALAAPTGYCGTCGQPTSSPTAPAAWQSDATIQFGAVPHAEPYAPPPALPAPYTYAPPAVPAMPYGQPTIGYGRPGHDQPTTQFYGGPATQHPPDGQPVSPTPPSYGQPTPPYGQPVSPAPASYPPGQLSGPQPIQPYPGQAQPYGQGQGQPYGPGQGQPYQAAYPYGPPPQQPPNRLSIVAFVLAAIALIILPIVFGVAGIACGAVALKRGERLGKPSLIVAIAATALSMIGGIFLRLT